MMLWVLTVFVLFSAMIIEPASAMMIQRAEVFFSVPRPSSRGTENYAKPMSLSFFQQKGCVWSVSRSPSIHAAVTRDVSSDDKDFNGKGKISPQNNNPEAKAAEFFSNKFFYLGNETLAASPILAERRDEKFGSKTVEAALKEIESEGDIDNYFIGIILSGIDVVHSYWREIRLSIEETKNEEKHDCIDLWEKEEIQIYLNRKVTAIKLPRKVAGDKTYPGLILDGASGVGKTQQAFALLNSGEKLVYRLLTTSDDNQQGIYEEMRKIVDLKDIFLKLVDNAIIDLEGRAQTIKLGQDPFSVAFLDTQSEIHDETPLNILITHLAYTTLQYDIHTRKLFHLKLKPTKKDLELVVLFLDEVLPKSVASQDKVKALSRLRFLRNLGRSLGMQVILAGTAATAANMIAPPNEGGCDSRSGDAEEGWMEIEFLYKHIDLQLPEAVRSSTTYSERPLLMSLLEKMKMSKTGNETGVEILSQLGQRICKQKEFSDDSMLIWLCGPWLDTGKAIPSSPFPITPAELVRGHFFEPAFAVNELSNNPYFGKGMGKIACIKGPCRLYLHKEEIGEHVWWQLGSDATDANAKNRIEPAYSKGFAGIQNCFCHCVQICLALEPVMAVCLTACRNFCNEDNHNRNTVNASKFQVTFSNMWQETMPRRIVGGIDGELNEYAMFAALQLASRSCYSFLTTLSVKNMIEPLRSLLYAPPDKHFEDRDDSSPEHIKYWFGRDDTVQEHEIAHIQEVFSNTFMPWLVPACSFSSLARTMQKGGLDIYSTYNIAGLVPSDRNSKLDAYAYLWGKSPVLTWAFEFRGRSGTYSLAEGQRDLMKKCNDNKGEKLESHGMLVAVSGLTKTEVRVWLTDDDKLRVVLVVGCGG